MTMHEYSFTWTPPEYVRACHAITRHMRGVVSFLPVLYASSLILFLAAPFATGAPHASTIVFSMASLLLLLALFSYWGAPWLRARRALREDPSAGDPVRHIVSPEGFSVRTRNVAVDLKWAHVPQVVETPEFFLFYFSKRGAYYTPKRAVPQNDLEALRAALRQALGERAQVAPERVVAA